MMESLTKGRSLGWEQVYEKKFCFRHSISARSCFFKCGLQSISSTWELAGNADLIPGLLSQGPQLICVPVQFEKHLYRQFFFFNRTFYCRNSCYKNQGRRRGQMFQTQTEENVIEENFQILFACLLPVMNFLPFLPGSSQWCFLCKCPWRTGSGGGTLSSSETCRFRASLKIIVRTNKMILQTSVNCEL